MIIDKFCTISITLVCQKVVLVSLHQLCTLRVTETMFINYILYWKCWSMEIMWNKSIVEVWVKKNTLWQNPEKHWKDEHFLTLISPYYLLLSTWDVLWTCTFEISLYVFHNRYLYYYKMNRLSSCLRCNTSLDSVLFWIR